MLTYDVVVATRHRADALELSLPHITAQIPPPSQVLVIDSSEDDLTETVVAAHAASTAVPVKYRRASAGLPHQRNVGLAEVTAPVVVFLDDDSITYPGYGKAILEVYARDVNREIGGVSGREQPPPPGFLEASSYEVPANRRFRQRIALPRTKLEAALFPDPFRLLAWDAWDRLPNPGWLEELDAARVEWMAGYRMSFRTDVIKRSGFDESFVEYALFEDTDASFAVMHEHLVVGAHRASVYHHQAPSGRGSARRLGATQVLNRAYVVIKHTEPGSRARRRLRAYGIYKTLQYAAGAKSDFGRERLRGAVAGVRALPRLLEAAPADVHRVYLDALDGILRDD